MIAVDSSVAIAAFGEWHELNSESRSVLDEGAAIPAHALLETYSVLTRFPPPYRAAPGLVDEWLKDRFSKILEPPSAAAHRALISALAGAERAGGAVYDALVAITAKRGDATLVTADSRAIPIYELFEVEHRQLVPRS